MAIDWWLNIVKEYYTAIINILLGFMFIGIYMFYNRFSKRLQKLKVLWEKKVTKDLYVNKKEYSLFAREDFKSKKIYYEAKEYDFFQDENIPSLKRYFMRKKRRKYGDRLLKINMELDAGEHKSFLVKEDADGFYTKNGFYIFYLPNRAYDSTSKISFYDYHQSFAMPIKRVIPVEEIKDMLRYSNATKIKHAFNPNTLLRFIHSQIAKWVIAGASIGKTFKFILIGIFILLILSFIIMVLGIYDSGLIEKISNKAS